MSKDHGPWRDGHRAWNRLREWQRDGEGARRPDDGDGALAALGDVGTIRRLLDEVELVGVRTSRRHGRSWAEIATKLGVSRQSAWERWRELDGSPSASPAPAIDRSNLSAADAAFTVRAGGARPHATVAVPNVIGLSWVEARDLLIAKQLVGGLDASSPMALTLEESGTVADQSPESGAKVVPGSMVTLWLRSDGGGSAGVREPRRPRPTPKTGRALEYDPSERGSRLMAPRD